MNEIRTGTLNGHRAIYLENDLLRVCILPDKGADIAELIHKPSGVDCLAKTPWGLKPPGAAPATDFLENYEGGWQEMFPSSNDACEVRGHAIPFHGETPLLPWEVTRFWRMPATRLPCASAYRAAPCRCAWSGRCVCERVSRR